MVLSTIVFLLFYKPQYFQYMALFIGTIAGLSLFLAFFDAFLNVLKPNEYKESS
jgi:xanthine/uracil permease